MIASITVPKKCSKCGKHTDGLMRCSLPDGTVYELCPSCMKKDGSFCYGCGEFCAGMESFDFIHPGFCDICWDEIEDMQEDWEEADFIDDEED